MNKTSDSSEKTISIDTLHIQLGYFEGKILTIVDASYSDVEQRNAVKTLVKNAFRDKRNHFDDIVYGGGRMNQVSSEA